MENTSPKVSVLVPVYNDEKYLARCLDSILGQSLKDIEVVCVDDAGPDGSAAILAAYAAKDPRVKIITKTRNEGLMMARKTAYGVARGEYFFFCDSDDYLTEGALERLYAAAKGADADVAVGEFYYENSAGRRTIGHRTGRLTSDPASFLRAMMSGTICTLWGSLYHRSLFDGHDYETFMNHSFSEDRLLHFQLLPYARRLVAVDSPTYVYFLNSGAMTSRRLTDAKLKEFMRAQNRCLEYMADKAEFAPAATRHYVRTLSFMLESGYDRRLVEEFAGDNVRLLSFAAMRAIVGPRLAFHTWMCARNPLYRSCVSRGRKVIQTILGHRK